MIARPGWRLGAQLFDELVIDNFAGGGGASIGIEHALGRAVDVAINHDPEAVALHRANHPATRHLCQDVFQASPLEVTGGRPVGLAWFSPDCTYFSKARGGKPIRDVKRRDLAWVVIRWAKTVAPRVIFLENVEEFRTWGPLTAEGRPCPERRGRTFERWVGELRSAGYEVEWRELRACDFGAPTTRKRLFLIARRDGEPIEWPEPTHGQGRGRKFRTAAECIDWTIHVPSIFERAKPLAENTLRRIAVGVRRFVLEDPRPFVMNNMTNNVPRAADAPLQTILTGPHKYVVEPFGVKLKGTSRASLDSTAVGLDRPLSTICAGAAHHAVVGPFTVATNHGDSRGRRTYPLDEPMRTVCAGARSEALVAPFTIPRHGERAGQEPRCRSLERPAPTVTGTANGASLVAGWLAKHYGGVVGHRIDRPVGTLTTKDHHALAIGQLGGRNDHGLEAAALVARLAPGEVCLDEAGRLLVHVEGQDHALVDLGMRMHEPTELFRCQGFPRDYIDDRGVDERGAVVKLTKAARTRLCGNSVAPPVVEALVRANLLAARKAVTA